MSDPMPNPNAILAAIGAERLAAYGVTRLSIIEDDVDGAPGYILVATVSRELWERIKATPQFGYPPRLIALYAEFNMVAASAGLAGLPLMCEPLALAIGVQRTLTDEPGDLLEQVRARETGRESYMLVEAIPAAMLDEHTSPEEFDALAAQPGGQWAVTLYTNFGWYDTAMAPTWYALAVRPPGDGPIDSDQAQVIVRAVWPGWNLATLRPLDENVAEIRASLNRSPAAWVDIP